jgi:hypothetical protein
MCFGKLSTRQTSYTGSGPELIEEARLEMEILEEEISESQGSMGFIVG